MDGRRDDVSDLLTATDCVVEYLRGRPGAQTVLQSCHCAGLAISLITYGAILEGIYYGRDSKGYAPPRDMLSLWNALGTGHEYANMGEEPREMGASFSREDRVVDWNKGGAL